MTNTITTILSGRGKHMKLKRVTVAALAVLGLGLGLGACSQDSSNSGGATPAAPAQAQNDFTLPAEKPAGLKSGAKIALVRQSGIGDYFEQWGNGFTKQVAAAGGQVTTFDARGDNGQQVTLLDQAITAKPDAIVVDHGLADSVNPGIDKAIAAGIPVVVYDVAVSNPKALYISQNDESIAGKILDAMKKDHPAGGNIAYVNVSGIAPLDSRNAVYEKFLADNPSFKQVVKFGKYSQSTAADTASEGAAALKAHPDVNLVFAAYDELAKGALIALNQDNMSSKVTMYGVDTSTADIQLMTEPGSPWVATAATDPANVGAIVGRGGIAAAAKVDLPSKMTIPAALITQQVLKEKGVTNMDGLRAAFPELNTPNVLGAPWIPQIKPGA